MRGQKLSKHMSKRVMSLKFNHEKDSKGNRLNTSSDVILICSPPFHGLLKDAVNSSTIQCQLDTRSFHKTCLIIIIKLPMA